METSSHAHVSKIALTKTASNYKNIHVSYYLFIEALENLLDFSFHLFVHNVILCAMNGSISLLLKLTSFEICFMKERSNSNKLVWILKSSC